MCNHATKYLVLTVYVCVRPCSCKIMAKLAETYGLGKKRFTKTICIVGVAFLRQFGARRHLKVVQRHESTDYLEFHNPQHNGSLRIEIYSMKSIPTKNDWGKQTNLIQPTSHFLFGIHIQMG